MDKLEKIIRGLEAIVNDDWMWKNADYYAGICKDALSLLKAHGPVKPTVEHNYAGLPMWCCGNCGTTLFFKFHKQTDDEDERNNYRFCSYCGRKVKWK